MFSRQNQYTVVHDFGVRVKDEREQDRNHLVEVGFEMPLTYELADEILPAMARDLFIQVKGDWTPRPEMREAVFNLAPAMQVMDVRNHPELTGETIQGVQLRKIKAVKGDGDVWMLRFTASWTLGNPNEVILMITRLRLGVYVTFREQQPALNLQPEAAAAAEGTEGSEGSGGDDKPKRGRKKRTRPEDDQRLRQQQLDEGKKLAAADDGDQATDAEPADDQPALDQPGEVVQFPSSASEADPMDDQPADGQPAE